MCNANKTKTIVSICKICEHESEIEAEWRQKEKEELE